MTAQSLRSIIATLALFGATQTLSDQITEIDRNVRRSGQFKETLALGLSYRLF